MKAYWDAEDHSYIIENENGKRMRITSGRVEVNPASDHVVMTDAVLIHGVDPLDLFSIGDEVNPDEVAREGVILRLIGTEGLIIYCEGHWRLPNGNLLGFPVDKAVLHSKRDDVFLKIVRNRLMRF